MLFVHFFLFLHLFYVCYVSILFMFLHLFLCVLCVNSFSVLTSVFMCVMCKLVLFLHLFCISYMSIFLFLHLFYISYLSISSILTSVRHHPYFPFPFEVQTPCLPAFMSTTTWPTFVGIFPNRFLTWKFSRKNDLKNLGNRWDWSKKYVTIF